MKHRVKILYMLSSETPCWYDYIIPLIVFIVSFVCFDQAFDMRLTMLQSSDLLWCITHGKFFQFYSHTLEVASTTRYLSMPVDVGAASYNIMIYLTMAIWEIPLYLLNRHFRFANYIDMLNIWGRIMVITFAFASMLILTKLIRHLDYSDKQIKWLRYCYISSPIILFCAIVFNQYDILSVFFTLIAMNYYASKKYHHFSLLMSLAICYKLFALIIFIPLLLLAEKKLSKLLLYIAEGSVLYIITTSVPSYIDPGYNATMNLWKSNFGFFQWIYHSSVPASLGNISLFIFSYIIICVYAYWFNPSPAHLNQIAMYFATAAYAIFFIFVKWHPQWMIIIVPFILMTEFTVQSWKLVSLLDIGFSVSFMMINSMKYLDNSLISNTILSHWLQYSPHSDVTVLSEFMAKHSISVDCAVTLFAVCLILIILLSMYEFRAGKSLNCSLCKGDICTYRLLLYCRTLTLLVYILPPLFVFFKEYRFRS